MKTVMNGELIRILKEGVELLARHSRSTRLEKLDRNISFSQDSW
jgi:hypothetical protein